MTKLLAFFGTAARRFGVCATVAVALPLASASAATIGSDPNGTNIFELAPMDVAPIFPSNPLTNLNDDPAPNRIRICGAPGHEPLLAGTLETDHAWLYAFAAWVSVGDTCDNFVPADITLRNMRAGANILQDEHTCTDAQWCFASFTEADERGTACYEVMVSYQEQVLTAARCGNAGATVTSPPSLQRDSQSQFGFGTPGPSNLNDIGL